MMNSNEKKSLIILAAIIVVFSVGYIFADVYITKDFSIINENNAKLIQKVFNYNPPAAKATRGRKAQKSL